MLVNLISDRRRLKIQNQKPADHSYSLQTPRTVKRNWSKLLGKVQEKNRVIKNIQQKGRRSQEKLHRIVTELSRQELLNQETENLLIMYKDTPISELLLGKTGRGYSLQQRHFATTLYYYSPAAYRYLRRKFKLPSPRIISSWLKSIDGSPGITKQSFDTIASKINSPDKAKYQLCCLHIDEMEIRKFLEYDKTTKKVYGYVDIGAGQLNYVCLQ